MSQYLYIVEFFPLLFCMHLNLNSLDLIWIYCYVTYTLTLSSSAQSETPNLELHKCKLFVLMQ